jgi:hypothetical protein
MPALDVANQERSAHQIYLRLAIPAQLILAQLLKLLFRYASTCTCPPAGLGLLTDSC